MVSMEFSEWPGAWERQVLRRHEHPYFFAGNQAPTRTELIQAQQLDQSELAQLESELAHLVSRCNEITESAGIEVIKEIKACLLYTSPSPRDS